MTSTNSTSLIIGAGMAGLMAAHTLHRAGISPIVLDKGRGVGGRMSTRRFGGATFDHGAQFFTVRTDTIQTWVERWQANGDAALWSHGFVNGNGDLPSGKNPRYRGTHGMTSIPKALAAGLPDVRVSHQVTEIIADEHGWRVTVKRLDDDSLHIFTADTLMMTPPAEQSLALMVQVALPEAVKAALQAITFKPSFAVMLRLDRPSTVPVPGAVQLNGEPISWISDNQQKGISDVPAVTIHAGAQFTREHYDDDREAVAAKLIAAARPYLGDAEIQETQIHRWKFSQPEVMHPEPALVSATPYPVAFAGDAFEGARVEGAALSGIAAANAILEHVK
jgi:renalase